MPVPSNAIKSLEEAIGHAVDAANLQEEQLSPDAVVRFVGQHLMRCTTTAATKEPMVVRKLRADVARGDQLEMPSSTCQRRSQAESVLVRAWIKLVRLG